ncbi:MAG: DUF3108 domain-containing protein [Tidjanibacter sp.]|nr:DUF3108 domain-containing protein [Tidjanibacter sp.]
MRFFYTLLFTLTVTSLLTVQRVTAQPLASGAFVPGESLTYTISFRSKVLIGANIGEVTSEVVGESVDGTPAWRISARAVTNKMARVVFKLDDQLNTWLATSDGLPVQFKQDINEGGWQSESQYYYNWNNGTALARYRQYDDPWRDTNLKIDTSVRDYLAHFYALRNNNIINTMRKGDSRKIGIILNDQIQYISYTYLGAEEKDITGIGKVRTIKLECQIALPNGEKLAEGNIFHLWISNDRNYIPLYLETPTRYGIAKARLSSYAGLKYPWESVLLGSKLKTEK